MKGLRIDALEHQLQGRTTELATVQHHNVALLHELQATQQLVMQREQELQHVAQHLVAVLQAMVPPGQPEQPAAGEEAAVADAVSAVDTAESVGQSKPQGPPGLRVLVADSLVPQFYEEVGQLAIRVGDTYVVAPPPAGAA